MTSKFLVQFYLFIATSCLQFGEVKYLRTEKLGRDHDGMEPYLSCKERIQNSSHKFTIESSTILKNLRR